MGHGTVHPALRTGNAVGRTKFCRAMAAAATARQAAAAALARALATALRELPRRRGRRRRRAVAPRGAGCCAA
eukprot:2160441-Prymnesium_polylepis.1